MLTSSPTGGLFLYMPYSRCEGTEGAEGAGTIKRRGAEVSQRRAEELESRQTRTDGAALRASALLQLLGDLLRAIGVVAGELEVVRLELVFRLLQEQLRLVVQLLLLP